MDYQTLLYGPIYDVLGVPGILHMGGLLGDVPVTVIDKTAGLTLQQAVDVQTVRPAAAVRAAELVARGVNLDKVTDKILTFNGGDWQIVGLHPNPSPNGEADGQIWLILDGGVG